MVKFNMKKMLFLCLALFMILIVPVNAEETDVSVDVDSVEIVYDEEQTVIEAGDNITYNKNVLGSSVIAGNSVKVTSNIDGILLGAGSAFNNSGISEYALLAGNTVDLYGTTLKDALIAGNVVTFSEESNINRDLFVFASTVNLSGTIGRNVTIYADTVNVELLNVEGNVKIIANKINIQDTVSIKQELTYKKGDQVHISDNAEIGSTNELYLEEESNLLDNTLSSLVSYVSLLFVFVVMVLATPKIFKKTEKCEFSFNKVLSLSGNGLLFLILMPMGLILLFTLVIGIPLALILLAIYFVAIYLSTIFAGYYVGKNICAKYYPKQDNILLQGLIGITVIKVLTLIPFLGTLIFMISLITGIGLMIETMKKK